MNLYVMCMLNYSCIGKNYGWGCLRGHEGCRSDMSEPRLLSTAWRSLDCRQATPQCSRIPWVSLVMCVIGCLTG